jgi:Tol biopolymer transport system component/C-terminal processing protease CtpA/Prc
MRAVFSGSVSSFACIAATLLMAAAIAGQQARPGAVAPAPAFAEPAISPDGSQIAFASGGDIWTVPAAGGDARLLISHPATESRPHWSPDGRRLAFVSTRTGAGDIYVLTLDTGDVGRITWDDAPEQLDGWSADGEWLYVFSNSRDVAGMSDVMRVRATGGTPMPVTAERYTSEFFASPSPDGGRLAFSARGIAAAQWWRRGHSHIDESEIWIRDAAGAYQQAVGRGAKALWPMWSADGRSLYYMSDRSGAENIWLTPAGAREGRDQARPLTTFTNGRVLWPTISRDGRTIAFERNFGIWTLNTGTRDVREVPIRRVGAPAGAAVDRLRLTSQIRELALSPDGRKLLFVVRGEIFAASAQQGGDSQRITRTAGNESQVVWAPDSVRAAYVSDRNGVAQLFLYDIAAEKEDRLTTGTQPDYAPVFSPDGSMLAFLRDRRELRVIDLKTKQERLLVSGTFPGSIDASGPIAFSPDSRWIAYLSSGARMFTNVSLVPAGGGETRPVSFLSNVNSDALAWSPDGTFLTIATAQRTERGQVARVDLILRTPKFREDQFRELFRREPVRDATTSTPPAPAGAPPDTAKPAPPASAATTPPASAPATTAKTASEKPPVDIVFADIRRRLNFIPVGVDVGEQTISPDGKWLLLNASAAGQRNLYLYSIDELSDEPPVARQLTSTPGPKASAQFSPDSREIFYLDEGTIRVVPVLRGEGRRVNVTAEMDVEFASEKMEVFHQAWTLLRDNFFDPKFNGVDWTAARGRFEPYVMGAATADEMRRVMAQMIGELNASHLNITAPAGQAPVTTGRLGLRFDPAEYEARGRLKITEVLPLGPAAITRAIQPGQLLLAVDGTAIDGRTNLDRLLESRVDRRVVLTIGDGPDGTNRRDVPVRPVRLTTEKGLLYRAWVEQQREYVRAASNGRLGYVHMLDMSQQSLDQLSLDLDSENFTRDGVVVDVRNNNGGFVNVYAIDVLARRSYFNMTMRGTTATPARTVLGQRSLELPTVLVTNQHSLSDAEDFTEGYRSLRLGKVVGEPTAGWIIYTWNTTLIDGSAFRLPRIRITSADGKDMELHPRPVDIPVTRALGEGAAGRDSQLDAAVKTLLEQIDRRSTSN